MLFAKIWPKRGRSRREPKNNTYLLSNSHALVGKVWPGMGGTLRERKKCPRNVSESHFWQCFMATEILPKIWFGDRPS